MRLMLALITLMLFVSTADARRHRTHVVVSKPYIVRPAHPIVTVPVAIIPPFAVFYDLSRRISCQGDILGMGGPGFSEPIPVGNVMIPAQQRGACSVNPH